MKVVLCLIMFVFTIASCAKHEMPAEQDQGDLFGSHLNRGFGIGIRDAKGNDLLAKSTAHGYTDDDIIVGQYDKKGNLVKGSGYSKGYIELDFDEKYIQIFPAGPFFQDLPHDDDKIYTTILRIGDNNPADTLECQFKTGVAPATGKNKGQYGGAFIELDKVWVNGKLMWDSTVNEYPYFVIVKKPKTK